MDKKQNFMCLKWPWEANGGKKGGNAGGCEAGTPWLFQVVGSAGQAITSLVSSNQFGQAAWRKLKVSSSPSLSPQEQGEAEERALASALATKKEATLIEFYSPRCRLCASLVNTVAEVEAREAEWLNIVMADVENKAWLAEVLHYDIKYVPCFVLLDTFGTALAKTGTPASRLHVLTGLSYLLESTRPIKKTMKDAHPSVNKNTKKSR